MATRSRVGVGRSSRGGVLLETMVAMALMVMVGLLALGIARDASKATERADRRAAAVELADCPLTQWGEAHDEVQQPQAAA